MKNCTYKILEDGGDTQDPQANPFGYDPNNILMQASNYKKFLSQKQYKDQPFIKRIRQGKIQGSNLTTRSLPDGSDMLFDKSIVPKGQDWWNYTNDSTAVKLPKGAGSTLSNLMNTEDLHKGFKDGGKTPVIANMGATTYMVADDGFYQYPKERTYTTYPESRQRPKTKLPDNKDSLWLNPYEERYIGTPTKEFPNYENTDLYDAAPARDVLRQNKEEEQWHILNDNEPKEL